MTQSTDIYIYILKIYIKENLAFLHTSSGGSQKIYYEQDSPWRHELSRSIHQDPMLPFFVCWTNSRDLPGFFRGFPPSDVALVIVPLVGWNDRQPLVFFWSKGVLTQKLLQHQEIFFLEISMQDNWMFVNTPLACGCFFLFVFFCALFSPYLLLEFSKDLKKKRPKKRQHKCCVEDQGNADLCPSAICRKQSATDGTDTDVNIGFQMFQGLVAYGFRAKSTPRKINMVHLQITHEKQGKWSEPNHHFWSSMLIFRGVQPRCGVSTDGSHQPCTMGNHGKNPRRGTPLLAAYCTRLNIAGLKGLYNY